MPSRRETLQLSALVAGLLATSGLLPHIALAADLPKAFDATTPAKAYEALGLAAPQESSLITLTAADKVDSGLNVPLVAKFPASGVRQLLLLAEKNPTSLIASFNFVANMGTSVSIRCRLHQSTKVFAVAVMTDGKVLFGQQQISVALSGFGA